MLLNRHKSLGPKKGKQAEAEVLPSSSLVEVKVEAGVKVEVDVEVEFEVGVEFEVEVGVDIGFLRCNLDAT